MSEFEKENNGEENFKSIDADNSEAVVEAALFLAGKFLSIQDIVAFTGINPLMVKEHIAKIQSKYENSQSGLYIVNKNEMFKMDVRPEFA